MGNISTYLEKDHLRSVASDRPQGFHIVASLASDAADNGDDISLMNIPAGMVPMGVIYNISATLGASCTSQLRVGTTAITAATTAGGADTEQQNAYVAPSTSVTTLNLLIGGADITGAAVATVQGMLVPVRSQTIPTTTVE